jgi:LysR family pca operon transcriptional activator
MLSVKLAWRSSPHGPGNGHRLKRHLHHRLKFRHLRVINAICTHESILQAAKAINLSQPALSRALSEVEEVVGARLFERHTRGVTATEFGQVVGESARRILSEINHLEDKLDALEGGAGGAVVVGALPVTAAGVLPGALARFQARHPGIEVSIVQGRSEELLSALALRDVDFVLGRLYAPKSPDAFLRTVLYNETIGVIARSDHPIFASPRIGVDHLKVYDLILPTISQRVGQEIETYLATLGLSADRAIRSSSISLIRETLHHTDSITIMPSVMLIGDIQRGGLKVLPLAPSAPDRPAGLIRRGDAALLGNARAFVDAFKAYARSVGKTVAAFKDENAQVL